jgi:signal transduction histidine kinase
MRKDTAFVAFTGLASLASAVKALRLGFRDYIVWPQEADLLDSRLKQLLAEVETARFREDMMCMITHDIKIPLSSILGYSALLVDKASGRLHVRAGEFARIIQGNALRIQALIENFLTTCKIDSGKLYICYRQVDLRRLLEDVAETFQVEVARHDLNLVLELAHEPVETGGDESLLFRAIGNMVGNACKFTPGGGTITLGMKRISAQHSPLGQDCVEIFVSNPGAGIMGDELDSVFERFHRGEGHGAAEGSGLGAFVLKSIIQAHEGDVRAVSIPNQLTTFSAYLPLKLPFNAED